jgi:hypothetical protein
MREQQFGSHDDAIRQHAALNKVGNARLSDTTYYIQNLERKIATLDHKLNMILNKLSEIEEECEE